VSFAPEDVRQLEEQGVSVAEARRQVALLGSPRHYVELVRPCTVGDGVVRLEEEEFAGLYVAHAEAAGAGRVLKFVPSSGAATRMFKSLLYFREGPGVGTTWDAVVAGARDGEPRARELVLFVEQIRRFAFYEDLKGWLKTRGRDLDALAAEGDYAPILRGLLDEEGLDYDAQPKGLLKFHRYPAGGRTAFEEHLVQANEYARGRDGVCRLHFTIMPRFREVYEKTAQWAVEQRLAGDARFEIGYSVQKPSTDTLSLDEAGGLVRDGSGRLLFRPGGHGALIENLNDLEGDVVLVRNIDNVRPQGEARLGSRWRRALAGYLVCLQREVFGYLERLGRPEATPPTVEAARVFARDRLGVDLDCEPGAITTQGSRARLISKLNRPLRVCGVVPHTGEPGGGPFWIRDGDGRIGLQIVEASQVDPADGDQQAILRTSTHFNPVDLVCGVRDHRGRPFDLARFIDPEAVIVTRKSAAGRDLWALERPGLWNGAMARWNTVFVEVPIESFTPVKSVVDLLRDEHQPV